MKRIGATLQAIREQRKLTLQEVEERSRIFAQERSDDSFRISASWLGGIEKEQHELTVKTLLVLAYIYGLRAEELFRSIYPDPLGSYPPPDETMLLSPEHDPVQGAYTRAIIGKQDNTLAPLIPAGSVVQIDSRRRAISAAKEWAHELQRPIYFLMTGDGYFCGWCALDPLAEWLTLVPHPLSPASSRSWKYPKEVEIMGRVVAVSTPLTPTESDRQHSPGSS
jgi:transcriptional regulator with XRE-family HTH domain